MPELPEVETIRRQLDPELRGRSIVGAEIIDERWSRPETPARIEAALLGRRIEAVGRRGKYLLLSLDDRSTLLMHLRAQFELDDGGLLRFTDPRRFGHGSLLGPADLGPYLDARIGIEPLEPGMTAAYIGEAAAGRTAPLKSFLLDQKWIAGIGNIYADEALHRAELHPLSPAGSMRPEHWEALREGIVAALEEGLSNGGASIDDYRDSRGEKGAMQDEFLVHTRERLDCPRCGGTIRRIVVSGRSTYFCPDCQVRLRRRPRRRRPRRG